MWQSNVSLTSSSSISDDNASDGDSDTGTVIVANTNTASINGGGDDDDNDDDHLPLPAHPTLPANTTTTKGRACEQHVQTADPARPPAEDVAAALAPPGPYDAIITFSPPRSSSSYRLHDYTSSPAPSFAEAVPRLEWPVPAGGLNDEGVVVGAGGAGDAGDAGREDGMGTAMGSEGRVVPGDRRSFMSLGVTALPRVYMTEVYRPRARARAGSESDLLRPVGGIGAGAGAGVSCEDGGLADVKHGGKLGGERDLDKGKQKGFKGRVRGWFSRGKKGSEVGRKVEEEGEEAAEGGGEAGEEIDFLEALRTTSPGSKVMMSGAVGGGGGSGGTVKRSRFEARGAGGKVEEQSELNKLRRENEVLRKENEALKAKKE
jgi:hypothetical protein